MDSISCEICYEIPQDFVILNCTHQLCLQCFHLGVLPKLQCPFCKQTVTHVTISGQLRDIQEFERPSNKQDFFEESNFDLINQDFFDQDLQVLHMNVQRTYTAMTRNIKQIDHQFNMKWAIFDQIEAQIHRIVLNDPLRAYEEITHLNICLQHIQQNHWGTEQLQPYVQIYKVDNVVENVFAIKQKRKRNKH